MQTMSSGYNKNICRRTFEEARFAVHINGCVTSHIH